MAGRHGRRGGNPDHRRPVRDHRWGIGSFVTVDYLRIAGVPTEQIRVLSNIDHPWQAFEYLTRLTDPPPRADQVRLGVASRQHLGFPVLRDRGPIQRWTDLEAGTTRAGGLALLVADDLPDDLVPSVDARRLPAGGAAIVPDAPAQDPAPEDVEPHGGTGPPSLPSVPSPTVAVDRTEPFSSVVFVGAEAPRPDKCAPLPIAVRPPEPDVPDAPLPAHPPEDDSAIVVGVYCVAATPMRLPVDDEYVAVKVLSGPTSEDVFRRATRELSAFAAVQSPQLVTLYDAGQQGSSFYYAMEYLAEGSLAQVGDGTRPDRDMVVTAVADAARAVHALHDAGICTGTSSPTTSCSRTGGAS